MELIIKTLKGFEEILADEVKTLLGRPATIGRRAVFVEGDLSDLYTLNYRLRTAIRVLTFKQSFKVHSYEDVYRELRAIEWSEIFSLQENFSIDATVFSPYFKNSQFVMHKAKDAVVDYFRDTYGRRPNVELNNPDIRLNIHITEREMKLNLDSSGESLHKRGYKTLQSEAPLSEVLAAGMIQLSGWDQETPLLDPMCGSATLLTEAAFLKYNIPAQKYRDDFSFMNWKDFDRSLWLKVKKDAPKIKKVDQKLIFGSDIDQDLIQDVESSLRKNGLNDYIDLNHQNFFHTEELDKSYHIVMNPPYDKRIELDNAKEFYQMIGDTLKQKCKGSTAWVFSGEKPGEKNAIKFVGLRPSQKLILFNGPIESRFHKFELF